jgi:hypothetical protein
MKAVKNKTKVTEQGLKVTVNHALDKYDNVILAPKKVAEAKKAIKRIDFPKVRRLIAQSK